MKMPLEGIRVLEWTAWIAGPLAGMMLGDLGADVIKIEDKTTGDPMRGMIQTIGKVGGLALSQRNIYFEHCNRNKKSITLDLSKPEGKQITYELVKKSDVFLQNYRRSAAHKQKLDYATLSKINPKLVYVVASGWGSKGPDKDRPSFDYTGMARSGLMTSGGEEGDRPYNSVASLADHMSGMMCANAVVNGLFMRERLGIGQEIESSMLGASMFVQGVLFDMKLMTGHEQPKWSRNKPSNPLWNIYKCKDDNNWIALALIQADRQWKDLCQALGQPGLANDPRFSDITIRNKNSAEMVSTLDKVFSTKTRAEWMDVLTKYKDIVVEPVNSITDVINDPQVWDNNYLTEFEHPMYGKQKAIGFPMQFSQAETKIRMPAPEFGQHTEEVLNELLGYSWEKIEELRGKEII